MAEELAQQLLEKDRTESAVASPVASPGGSGQATPRGAAAERCEL
jgi:hypothetical protein